jgi:uncharacterized phiE125 gp8 family phage protein
MSYADRRTTPAEQLAPPVSLAALKTHLRIEHDDDDDDLAAKLDAARDYIEEQTNRSLSRAAWTVTFDRFPAGGRPQRLPRAPLVSVDQIDYETAAGPVTLDANALAAAGYQTRTDTEPGLLLPAYGATWPTDALNRPQSVRYTITAGHAQGAAPAVARQAVLLLAGHLYETREAAAPQQLHDLPPALGLPALLQQLRHDDWLSYDPRHQAPEQC